MMPVIDPDPSLEKNDEGTVRAHYWEMPPDEELLESFLKDIFENHHPSPQKKKKEIVLVISLFSHYRVISFAHIREGNPPWQCGAYFYFS